ncbi:hypothetical protein [Mesobacillus maritimus]|jgi:hypothetical protein|uniref:Uncharacterized protein n=1 Tax=Mesobacillus maritimus TaxID=1643336 RepID=A0ABS7K7L0_9BACI|nr:hypothetical protein [Mesobacillus maritimus]MBY0098075.1 hypothetical protein [Mesobacillus maritimus]
MSSIDFDDFYRICSDSNFEAVQEDVIILSRKKHQILNSKVKQSTPRLEDFEKSLDNHAAHSQKDQTVLQ